MNKERLKEFDVLRALAFLFIVLQHTLGGYSYRNDIPFHDFIISKFIYNIADIGVTLFFTMSAILLVYRYYEGINVIDFYKKKFKFLLIPFVLWSLIYLYNSNDINLNSIFGILAGKAQYHLWYMGMILRVYIYFPILIYITRYIHNKSKNFRIIFLILSFIIFRYIFVYLGDINSIILKYWPNISDIVQSYINITPLYYSFYFVFGAYVILNYKSFRKVILKHKIFVTGLYLTLMTYSFILKVNDNLVKPIPYVKSYIIINILTNIISLVFFFMLSYLIAYKNIYIYMIFNIISRYSFPAYLIHVLILNKLTLYVPTSIRISSYLRYFYIVSVSSILICMVMNYIPFTTCIIGIKTKFSFKKFIIFIHLCQKKLNMITYSIFNFKGLDH